MKATNLEELATYGNNDLPAKLEEKYSRLANSKAAAAIPQWAKWTEAQVLSWVEASIGTPLTSGRANLPTTLTLASVRVVIVALLDILDKMLVMMIALARMSIALRDHNFPDIE